MLYIKVTKLAKSPSKFSEINKYEYVLIYIKQNEATPINPTINSNFFIIVIRIRLNPKIPPKTPKNACLFLLSISIKEEQAHPTKMPIKLIVIASVLSDFCSQTSEKSVDIDFGPFSKSNKGFEQSSEHSW